MQPMAVEIKVQKLAPITLFVYKRLWHTSQTVEALRRNDFAEDSELYIFSDGPKDMESERKVREVREYIKTIDGFKKVHIIERERNWGLANNIVDGVTRIVNQYGRVIVLEDDIVTSPYFLRFMNEALEFYKNEKRVFGITGYAYPIRKEGLPSTFFLKDEGSWGWATWDRAWKHFRKDPDFLIRTFTREMIREFNFDNSMDFWSQVLLNKKGKINTWAIFWYATVFLNDALFLHPRESFVINIGHDGSGEHCGPTNCYNTQLIRTYDIEFPEEVKESQLARQRHIEYFRSLRKPLWKRVVKKLLRVSFKVLRK